MAILPALTDEQRQNLERLSAYLKALPADAARFDMADYTNDETGLHEVGCGTVACAVGHGPLAGVLPIENDNDWVDYADRAFGTDDIRVFDWCFESGWRLVDNSPHGAAKRIDQMLTKGIPDNYEDQLCGKGA